MYCIKFNTDCIKISICTIALLLLYPCTSLSVDRVPSKEALVGGVPSPSRPHHHGQPALQHPGVHHGGNAAGEPLSRRVEGVRAHPAQGQQVEQGAL